MVVDGEAIIARIRELSADEHELAGRWLVAFSGGLDSTVLLHLLASSPMRSSLPLLQAVHVHHGLQAEADAWEHHCREQCVALGVAYHGLHVRVLPRGRGLEDAAREARYRALAEFAAAGDAILMAHHADDQLETLLLRLVRGAGLDGMAGIPCRRPLGGAVVLRPLLEFDRHSLHQYALAHDLHWITDPSNENSRHDRNYLRRHVVPELVARWPGAARSAARAARHLSLAREQLDRRNDELLDDADFRAADGSIAVAPLRGLDSASRISLVRAWLARLRLPPLGERRLAACVTGLLDARPGTNPHVQVPTAELWRWLDRLYAVAPRPAFDARQCLWWRGGGDLVLPGAGRLRQEESGPGGLPAFDCAEIRFRRGGERSHPAGRSHSSSLKRMLQEFGVPPWLRERVPLLYLDGSLAAVGGYWVEKGFVAGAGTRACRICWEPGASL